MHQTGGGPAPFLGKGGRRVSLVRGFRWGKKKEGWLSRLIIKINPRKKKRSTSFVLGLREEEEGRNFESSLLQISKKEEEPRSTHEGGRKSLRIPER